MSENAAAAETNLNASTPSTLMAVTTEITSAAARAIDPLSHVGDGIFLQTKTAQGIAGICVWVALFLTCQQVNINFILFSKYPFRVSSYFCLSMCPKKER